MKIVEFVEIADQNFKLASRFARWFTQSLDFFVLLIPIIFVAGVLGKFGHSLEFPLALIWLIWLGFYLLFQDGINKGQSFGKRIMSMRVVNAETGAPCNYGKSVVRNLFIIIPLVNLIDALMIFGDRRQRLGDRLAKTIVVKGNPPKNGVPAEPPKPVKTFFVGMGILVGLGAVGYALFSKTPRNFESTDGLVQITAPMFWDNMTRYKQALQMEDSTLVICDESGEVWVMVITETKEELSRISLSQFAELVTDSIISNLSQMVSVSDPIQTTLNGSAAIQYEIQGIV